MNTFFFFLYCSLYLSSFYYTNEHEHFQKKKKKCIQSSCFVLDSVFIFLLSKCKKILQFEPRQIKSILVTVFSSLIRICILKKKKMIIPIFYRVNQKYCSCLCLVSLYLVSNFPYTSIPPFFFFLNT